MRRAPVGFTPRRSADVDGALSHAQATQAVVRETRFFGHFVQVLVDCGVRCLGFMGQHPPVIWPAPAVIGPVRDVEAVVDEAGLVAQTPPARHRRLSKRTMTR